MAISSPITSSSFKTPTLFKELKAINVVTLQLNREKKKRFALQRKFDSLQDRYAERTAYSEREASQESKKSDKTGGLGRKVFKPVATNLLGGLFGLFKIFLTYKALEWLANPKNREAVTNVVKVLFNVFKFVNALVGFGIDNLFTGLSEVLGGDTILERIGGVFKLLTGLFVITRVLRYANILNIFKDIGSIWKKRNIIARIFKQLGDRKFGDAIKNLFKLTFPKLSGLFRRGLGKTIQLTIRKVFGRGALKLITGIAKKLGLKTATNLVKVGLAKVAGGAAKGIPLVGPFIGLGINLLLGDSIDMALVKMAGAMAGQALGGLAGGAIGALFAGVGAAPGAAIGAFLGNILGDWLAGSLYGWIKSAFFKPKEPQLAAGGIVTQPTRAIVGEAGPEAVVPLSQLYGGEIFEKPLVNLGAGLIGGINAVISSMGPAGVMVRPFANQLLAPYTKDFGLDNYVFTSDLGKSSPTSVIKTGDAKGGKDKKLEKIMGDNTPKLLTDKDKNPRRRYNSGTSIFSLLGDIYNSLVNIEFGSGTTGPGRGPGAGPGAADQALTAAELDAIKASSADKRAAAHLATLEASAPQHVADVYQVILNRAAGQSGGIPAVITAKEQFSPYSAALYGDSADGAAARKYGGLGLTKKELFDLAAKSDGIQQLTNRFQAGNPKVAAQVLADFESNGPLSQNAKKFVGGAQYFMGYKVTGNDRRRPDGGNWFRDRYATGGVVNPVPSQNISTNKGGYASDTGLDILTPIGSRVVSPVAGTIEYAEKGHVRQMGQDANPNMPGMQDQHSVRIRLDKPFKFSGKEVKFFYATHLYQLNSAIANKSNVRISPGDLLGLSGVANNVPHVHVGFVEDREQNSFLNFQQVRSLLSGAPVQDSQQSPGSAPSTDSNTKQPEVVDWTGIAKSLGNLYTDFQGNPKTNGDLLSAESMAMVQNMKSVPFITDTYIMAPGSTTISSVNLIAPLPTTDYSVSAFSNLDSPTLLAKRNL